MYQFVSFINDKIGIVDNFDTLEEGIHQCLHMWFEGTPDTILGRKQDDGGRWRTYVILEPVQEKGEDEGYVRVIFTNAGGVFSKYLYHVKYILREDGGYLNTEVKCLG